MTTSTASDRKIVYYISGRDIYHMDSLCRAIRHIANPGRCQLRTARNNGLQPCMVCPSK